MAEDRTLAELAELLPGTGDVMVVVSRVYANLWFAAEGGNWELASFYFRRTRTLLRKLSLSRPKYADRIRDYQAGFLDPIGAACLARDWTAFETAYSAAVDRANQLHVETGYPYIRWIRPEQAPDPALDFGPGG
jgi:hypothetical protein